MSDTGIDLHNTLIQDTNTETRVCIEGICPECPGMCPQEEVTLREKEKQVHILEVTRSGHKLVKSYIHSVASCNMTAPSSLRPFHVLIRTVNYLLIEVPLRPDVTKQVLYDFLNDRLQAVRHDATIQRLPPEECVLLLEPMIRFYVYFAHILCEQPPSLYDPGLNKTLLLECMKWFLNCCDVLHKPENIQEIDLPTGKNPYSFDVTKSWPELSCDRILVESLYILCNLGDENPLNRYLNLPTYLKKVSALKLAYDIAIANMQGNFMRVQKLAKRLCPLNFSALTLHCNTIQRRGLQVLSHGYHNKHRSIPQPVLKDWLYFNSYEDVRRTCKHYGLKVDDKSHGILFTKDSFIEKEQLQPMKYYGAKIHNLELEEVMSYYLS